jgi:hypothetical protein
MIDPRFRAAEEQYGNLKGALAAGRMTPAQFEQALEAMMIEHDGRHWMLGANSGNWYAFDGQTWVESAPPDTRTARPIPSAAPPPPTATAAAPPLPPAPLHNKVLGCLLGCFAPVLFLLGAGIVIRGVMNHSDRPADTGMALLAGAAFLTLLALVPLLRVQLPVPLFLVLCGLWTLFGIVAVNSRFGRGLGLWHLPDALLVTGIAAFLGTLAGAAVRATTKPR